MRVQNLAPRDIRIQEPPPNPILPHLLHPSAPIEKRPQHPLSQFNNPLILFRFRRFGGIVTERMLLGNRGYDQCRVEVYERGAQASEFAVPPTDFDFAGPDGVGYVAAAAFGVLPCVHDLDF